MQFSVRQLAWRVAFVVGEELHSHRLPPPAVRHAMIEQARGQNGNRAARHGNVQRRDRLDCSRGRASWRASLKVTPVVDETRSNALPVDTLVANGFDWQHGPAGRVLVARDLAQL